MAFTRRIRRQILRSGAAVGFAGASLTVALQVGSLKAQAAAPHPIAPSYYISKNTNPSTSTLTNLGCSLGTLQGNTAGSLNIQAVLGFGAYKTSGNFTGWDANGVGWTPGQVSSLVQAFAAGYAYCSGSDLNSQLTISVMTNNSNSATNSSGYGAAFHNIVNGIANAVLATSYGNRVFVVGGIDAEPGYGSVSGTLGWMSGYAGTGGVSLTADMSADGLSTGSANYTATTPSVNGWTVEDIYQAFVPGNKTQIPQIYFNAQAIQWQKMSRYAATAHSQKIKFAGTMTEYGANSSTYAPDAGYDSLQTKLNADSLTAYTIPFDTDISWQ